MSGNTGHEGIDALILPERAARFGCSCSNGNYGSNFLHLDTVLLVTKILLERLNPINLARAYTFQAWLARLIYVELTHINICLNIVRDTSSFPAYNLVAL